MTLSASARAARENGYGSLSKFREVAATHGFQILAGHWARHHGMRNARAPLAATSVFARYFGKAFYKDGKRRSRPHRGYLNALARGTGLSVEEIERIVDY